MVEQHLRSITPTIDVYVKLAQYPILCDRIRLRMREELFRRGIIDRNEFEQEVKDQAIESQRREGLTNPTVQEDEGVWQRRLEVIRDVHTDSIFANNLGISLLDQLIEQELSHQHVPAATELTFNPEIAPWALLFRQGELYDALSPPEKERVKHHLAEIKVVLIKRLMSDQLAFLGVAKRVLTISDLRWIYERLIGGGKIGGKAGGMILAWRILEHSTSELGPDISEHVDIPQTFFLGSENIYEFILHNKLERFVNQKYLPLTEMEAEYPKIVDACECGEIPGFITEQLRDVLERLDGRPFIVRSSSLLEDHLDYSFVGKYNSTYCPNQGSPDENLEALLTAVKRIYASTFNPGAMIERQKHGLIDYDERMAIMIQALSGQAHGGYFLPTIVGSGMSRNPWADETGLRAEDGCVRLVWGFADRLNNNLDMGQACMVALSHPKRRLSGLAQPSNRYTQKYVKVIDLAANRFRRLPVETVLTVDYPYLRYVASGPAPDQLAAARQTSQEAGPYELTFDFLRRDGRFVKLMRTAFRRLEEVYGMPVQIEFTIDITSGRTGPEYQLNILQCHKHIG